MSWNRDTLPEGDEKVRAVREMFDAIAPRYDLVNRVMTFRLDVRWRRRTVEALALPAGSRVLDLASGTGDLCVDLAAAGLQPVSIDLSLGMLRADRSGAPRVQADVLRLPMADGTVDGVTCGFALRNLVELPAFFAELARVVRPGGRIALLDVGVPRNRLVRLGHGIYFGRIVPRVGGWLSDPAAYRYLPRSVAYLPPSDEMVVQLRRAGFGDATAPGVHARRGPAAHRHARRSSRTGLMRAVTRRADDATRALDLNDVARGDGFLFVRDGVGFAGRGIAARVAVDDVAAVLGAIDHVDETGFDAARSGVGPVALGWVPFAPGGAGEAVIPAVVVGKGADGSCWVTSIDDAVEALAPPSAPPATADSYTIEPVTPVERYLDAVVAARDAARAGRIVKAVIAREIRVVAGHPIDRHGVLHRLKAAFGSSYRFAIDGFVGASPELLVGVDGRAVTSYPLAGTAPRAGDPERDDEIAAELVASTKNQVEHRAVIDMVHDTLLPWCSYLDWEPEPGIVRVANVQHLGTRIEGRLSAPVPNVVTLVRALTPTPAVGGHPGRRGAGARRRGRGRRPRPLRRCGRLGRRGRQRDVGRGDPLRPALRRPHRRPPPRRRGHRRRQRPAGGARRDAGEVPGDAVGARSPLAGPPRVHGGVHGDVRRPIGDDARHVGSAAPDAGDQLGRRRHRRGIEAVGGGEGHEVGAVRGAEQLLEARRVEGRRLREEREDASAVVVDHDHSQVDAAPAQCRERSGIVQEGDVAQQHHHGPPRQGEAERRRHRAVDPVGPPVGVGPGGGTAVPLEVAHRHRRGDHELGIGLEAPLRSCGPPPAR